MMSLICQYILETSNATAPTAKVLGECDQQVHEPVSLVVPSDKSIFNRHKAVANRECHGRDAFFGGCGFPEIDQQNTRFIRLNRAGNSCTQMEIRMRAAPIGHESDRDKDVILASQIGWFKRNGAFKLLDVGHGVPRFAYHRI